MGHLLPLRPATEDLRPNTLLGKTMKPEAITTLKGHLLGAKALRDAMDRSLATAKPGYIWPHASYKQFMSKYNDLAHMVAKVVPITAPIGTWNLAQVKGSLDTTTVDQHEYFDAVYTNLNLLIAFLEHTIGLKADEIQSLRDFFAANLRRAVFEKPEKEKCIQDVVEQLLIGRGMARSVDYDRERGRVGVSIKEVIPDFNIPRLSLALEVKLSKDKTKSKEIVDEINADIQAYGRQYAAIIFIVYDLGSIQDEALFKVGLERREGHIHVLVIKH